MKRETIELIEAVVVCVWLAIPLAAIVWDDFTRGGEK